MNSLLDRRLERLETALGDSEMVKVTLSPEVREMIEQVSGMPCEEVSYVSAALANIRKIKRVEDSDGNWESVIEQAKTEGFDGLVYGNEVEDAGSDSYVVFSPTQIKSVNNRGTFDPNDPRILYHAPTGKPVLGYTDFNNPQAIIGFFKKADMSTIQAARKGGFFCCPHHRRSYIS